MDREEPGLPVGVDPAADQCRLLGEARLILQMQRQERRGIGRVMAVPAVQIAAETAAAAPLSQRLSQEPQPAWLRLPGGWVSAATLRQAGLAGFGRASDGTSLQPFPLTASDIVWPEQISMPGPWTTIEPLQLHYPRRKGRRAAQQHLEFLRYWGLAGGLVGTVHDTGAQLADWLQQYLRQESAARVLLLGSTVVLNYMSKLVAPNRLHRLDQRREPRPRVGQINCITPDGLQTAGACQQQAWDIVCLLNADTWLTARSQPLFSCLQSMEKSLFIGLFSRHAWREQMDTRQACAAVLGISEPSLSHLLWRYLLLDPEEPGTWPQRPPVVTGAGDALKLETVAAGPAWGMAYDYELRSFARDAQHYAPVAGSPVQPATYYSRHPRYSNMDQQQLSWYLYWRTAARHGRYLATSLDYIRLHVYELINGWGTSDAADGYHQLTALWQHYRQQWPALDNDFPGWLCDYLLVNGCFLDPLQPWRQAAALGLPVPYLDLLLQPYAEEGGIHQMPRALLQQWLDYDWEQRPIYDDQQLAQLQSAMQHALQRLEAYYQQQHGMTVLQYWQPHRAQICKRLPFAQAPFLQPQRLLYCGSSYAYSRQPALRILLLDMIKYLENKLRQKHNLRGRVRCRQLEAPVRQLLERAWHQSQPRRRVHIDMRRVVALKCQSDEIRDLLLTADVSSASPLPADEPGQPPQDGGAQPTALFTLQPLDLPQLAVELAQQMPGSSWQNNWAR